MGLGERVNKLWHSALAGVRGSITYGILMAAEGAAIGAIVGAHAVEKAATGYRNMESVIESMLEGTSLGGVSGAALGIPIGFLLLSYTAYREYHTINQSNLPGVRVCHGADDCRYVLKQDGYIACGCPYEPERNGFIWRTLGAGNCSGYKGKKDAA